MSPMTGSQVCCTFLDWHFVLTATLVPTEEMLLDFCVMTGEHSGENMAQEVQQTLQLYGLEKKVTFVFQIS